MVKEDRSGWVAVNPEFSNAKDDLPQVKPASTAYQIFQRQNTQLIKSRLSSRGEPSDLAALTKATSSSWQALPPDDKYEYEEEARADRFRFNRESHLRDIAVSEQKERLRRERNEIIVMEGDGRGTRGSRKRELRRAEKAGRKKGKKSKRKLKEILNSDEEEFRSDDDDDDDDSSSSGNYVSDNSSDSSSSTDSQRSRGKKKSKKRKAPVVSAAVLAKREAAKEEREKKEAYIAERQKDLRNDRAAQAKKRLDFLLKQSDIFRHFGEVKEDKGNFYKGKEAISGKPTDGEATHRRDSAETEQDDINEADENDATFLTSQPTTLGFGKMRAYQLEGLNWMIRLQENGVNGILADEMGLGKTLQSISVLVYMLEYQHLNGPHLIVVPKSTLSNWMAELKRWAPTLSPVKFHGNKEERETIVKELLQPGQRDEHRSWNVCVTTYEICNLDKQVLNKFAWSYLIIDEAHRLKNETSAFSRTIRTFETRYRLLLTGTPLQNNLHELWALLNFLVPDVFANAEQFDEWFNLDIDDADEKNRLISQLHKILRPFMLRRLKVDVEKSLPPKHETILFTGMSAMQKKLYKDILLRDIDVLQGKSSGSRTAVLNIVMQLRKCAGHPYLFPGVEDRSLPPLGEHLIENCGKMVLLDKLLTRLEERGHRVLLFTQMTRILDILEDYLVMRKFKYCRIDGNTDYEKREDSINAFNKPDSDKFMFLLSTRAGGLGINLQTADVVILYDSDWNPQADLQAQDRAHRIGQKRPVQIFRLVTEHTIEEKVVERAQQKLKLDAMVVQQGRLKDKDKLSRDDLLSAVRFGADKVFKSKDSSITDDDIDLILEAGKKKTQELNEKLTAADKGDMLDFKLDGGGSGVQTYEGVDYSKQDNSEIKAAQAQAELLGILDMGKRERKAVANYNEDQLYRQQVALNQPIKKKVERKKKDIKLPRHLRLPRLDEWQMFDRNALNAIQEEEEKTFRALPEELQMIVKGRLPNELNKMSSNEGNEKNGTDEGKAPLSISDVPPFISDEKQEQKESLLAEGFADWGRSHFTAFTKACARYGRHSFSKIALEVGKPTGCVKVYAKAFWDEDIGKKRFSEHEYDRNVKMIERGEKKIELIKVLETATTTFISLFDNPWVELEFTFVNVKDKLFTLEEDRHLLCWAHKYGYGQWEAVKMAIRRNPDFRFDYFLRSLPTDQIGRRCEQLMKSAEKEIEQMLKNAKGDAGLEEEKKDSDGKDESETKNAALIDINLPSFKTLQAMKRKASEDEFNNEKILLENKVEEVENQIEAMQNRLKALNNHNKELDGSGRKMSHLSEFPDEFLPDLANMVARSGYIGITSIANQFVKEHGQVTSKKQISAKIEDIAKKEKRKDEGDTRAIWHLLPEFTNMLTVETIRYLRKLKESRTESDRHVKLEQGVKEENDDEEIADGAPGPDGFLLFPNYDGIEEPRQCKKAFTHFCNKTRKKVKASLDSESRRDRDKVNKILKEKWLAFSDEEKHVWKKWQEWDAKRYERDIQIYERKMRKSDKKLLVGARNESEDNPPPKKKKEDIMEDDEKDSKGSFHIPKKSELFIDLKWSTTVFLSF